MDLVNLNRMKQSYHIQQGISATHDANVGDVWVELPIESFKHNIESDFFLKTIESVIMHEEIEISD
ncbi:mannonate dehydratase [Listeria cornellensis]